MFNRYGEPVEAPPSTMRYPMRCTRCGNIHDTAIVTVVQRYLDCSTWRCPGCNSLIDDRPVGWGGSAERFDGREWR